MPTDTITICGRGFTVPVPDRYNTGSTIELTAGESNSISKTFCENIRNNVSARMKKLDGFSGALDERLVGEWQEKVNEYATTYQFGIRGPGGREPAGDPETQTALSLIRPEIRKALVKKFGRRHGYTPDQVHEAAARLLDSDKGERYRRRAQQILRQKEEAVDDADLLAGLDVAAAAE